MLLGCRTNEDYQRITDFRPQGYQPKDIDWEGVNIDDGIVDLANNFEGFVK